jgi:hypothetical protein
MKFALAMLLLTVPAIAQQQPTVTLEFSFPQSQPSQYRLSIARSGEAVFEEPANDKQEPFHSEFRLPSSQTEQIFAAAKDLRFFDADYEYKKHKVANTGEKKLTYAGDGATHSTTFHFSENQRVTQLTAQLQGIAATQDFARKAAFDRRYDKLALDGDVKAFANAVKSGLATNIETIRPTLESLANDPAVLNTVRQRATQLLRSGSSQR